MKKKDIEKWLTILTVWSLINTILIATNFTLINDLLEFLLKKY